MERSAATRLKDSSRVDQHAAIGMATERRAATRLKRTHRVPGSRNRLDGGPATAVYVGRGTVSEKKGSRTATKGTEWEKKGTAVPAVRGHVPGVGQVAVRADHCNDKTRPAVPLAISLAGFIKGGGSWISPALLQSKKEEELLESK